VDGLSQSEVHDILEDSRGNLWFATRGGGINQFNGKKFTPFTSFDGLAHNNIQCLYEYNGLIWIGTDDGLSVFNGLEFKNYYYGDSSKTLVVGYINLSEDGELIFGTTKGLLKLENDQLVSVSNSLKFDYLNFLSKDQKGKLWIGISNRIYQYNSGNPKKISTSGLGSQKYSCDVFLPDGQHIVACYGGQLYTGNNKQFKTFLPDYPFHNKLYNALYVDKDQNLWIGTHNSGLYKLNLTDSSVTHLTIENGLANNHIESIYEDSWGNIWIGTGGGGISKYHKVAFSVLNEQSGLPGDWIYSCLTRKSGEVMIGAGAEGVTVMTDSTIENFRTLNGFISAKIRLMYEDSKNRVWLAPEGQGLWVYDSIFRKIRSDVPLIDFDHIKSITEDNDGYLWICEGGKGLLKIAYSDSTHQINTVAQFNTKNNLPRDYIFALHCDKANRIWYGTKNTGCGYILDGKSTLFTTKDGLASNAVSMIREDDDGYIWLAGGDGLTRIKAFSQVPEFKKFGQSDGLIGIPIYQIEVDPNGYLWVGTSNGVTRFTRSKGELSNPKHYGYTEGFIGLETNTNAVCVMPKNHSDKIYFGTGNGLMVYEGDADSEDHKAPNLSLTQIKLFYQPLSKFRPEVIGAWYQMKENITLNHDQNNLSFEFFGVNQSNPDNVEYSWILDGFEAEWTPPSQLTNATYSNLPPGKYTFNVKARTIDGKWSEIITSKQFTIEAPPPPPPPFYQQTWFIATVVGLSLFILMLIGTIWYTRLKRERERIKLERNVIELEQKALRLQMNPHFIFNALNSIQSLISSQDTKKARYQLAKFSKLMRQILDNSRSQIISLDDEMETLFNYLSIEKFSSGNQFDFEIHADEDLDPEGIAVPPMMIQPFTENAIIHGMKYIEHKGHIDVHFYKKGDIIECKIDDNGCGRKKAAEIKSQKEHSHKSAALIVTQERLNILHGNSNEKGLEIIDKYDDQLQANGTTVIIRFPYSEII
jgi:ligand-binding sensor domain-containing protein/two-component sensor histidine kinase